MPLLPRGEHDDFAEAVAWSLGRAVISHESALVLHGLSDVNPARVHLTTADPSNHPRGQGGNLYHIHRKLLLSSHITLVDGIPVTTAERTIADCAVAGVDPQQLDLALEQAAAMGLLSTTAANSLRTKIEGR